MSLETLNILEEHRDNQVELSPFSELFQIVGGSTFYGIFDKSHIEDNKDSGNVTQKKLKPRIIVSTVPSGLTERSTEITRANGTETYTFGFVGKDDAGTPLLWLL